MRTYGKVTAGLLCITGLLMTGCQGSEPEKPAAVVEKKQTAQVRTAKVKENNRLWQELGAEETFETTLSDETGNLSVKVNAKVVIPDVPGFKQKKVTGRIFTQEDADKVLQTLGKGQKLYTQVNLSKKEIETQLAKLEEEKDSYQQEDYQMLKEDLQSSYKSAPDTAETEVVDVTVGVSYQGEFGKENPGDYFAGTAKVDDKYYGFSLNNRWTDDWKWITLKMAAQKTNYKEGVLDPESIDKSQISVPLEVLKKQAEDLIKELGFQDMVCYGGEYYDNMAGAAEGNQNKEFGYGLHFVRQIDGIPITYTSAPGIAIPDDKDTPPEEMSTPWPYESLTVVYDKNGLATFRWENPYEIEDLSGEYVKLLPFSEIKNIFETMMLTTNAMYTGTEGEQKSRFHINEVRLGYMRIMEKGHPKEGTLIPVWDFLGTKETDYPAVPEYGDEASTQAISAPYYSWLTVNAMDGTIINRAYGY